MGVRPWGLVAIALVPVALGVTLSGAPAHAESTEPTGAGHGHDSRGAGQDATVSDRLAGTLGTVPGRPPRSNGPAARGGQGGHSTTGPAEGAATHAATMATASPSAAVGAVAATTPTAADAWSSVGTFRTAEGWYASPIHASLLPDGRVHVIGIARESNPPTPTTRARRVSWVFTPPPVGSAHPAETVITEVTEPVEHTGTPYGDASLYDDLYCASATLDDAGRVVTAGGTRIVSDRATGELRYTLGLPYQTVFDGTTWQRLPGEMVGRGYLDSAGRWYPTLTRLPDKRMLVTGGLELITPNASGTDNRSIETLDPHTGERALVSSHAATPVAIHARDYTSVFVLPYAAAASDLLMLADSGTPVTTAATANAPWNTLPRRTAHGTTDQPSWGASSVMLPIRTGAGAGAAYRNGSILVAGGDMVGTYQRSGDVLDPVTGTWGPSVDLGINRHHPDAVVLADGRVLLVAGHDMTGATDVERAQYVDPLSRFSVTTGTSASGVIRGYHSVALLLPDGRVLVGGGRDVVTADSLEKPTYQIYSPDYLARARPMIASAPSQLEYGALFQLPTVGTPSEVVLVALGSQTHSFDAGQRVVQLPVGATYNRADGAALSIVGTPPDSHVAPPGYYGLVVLDGARTPSVARVVHVG
ncbi:galactose oxidase-like domain-containing protein [Humibacillus xanthopallidus]|uniref:Kelch motif protein n=1 Tax=Humibacillus xanthopallidus TaxID=412689 RepID=A0A543HV40_9MICO|nr:galactose oxidase-like domain-containing protein [Humibacillus xanthopallidus]TQM62227.1 Kelch motif protein [Humibacillus xanthopallidus]